MKKVVYFIGSAAILSVLAAITLTACFAAKANKTDFESDESLLKIDETIKRVIDNPKFRMMYSVDGGLEEMDTYEITANSFEFSLKKLAKSDERARNKYSAEIYRIKTRSNYKEYYNFNLCGDNDWYIWEARSIANEVAENLGEYAPNQILNEFDFKNFEMRELSSDGNGYYSRNSDDKAVKYSYKFDYGKLYGIAADIGGAAKKLFVLELTEPFVHVPNYVIENSREIN